MIEKNLSLIPLNKIVKKWVVLLYAVVILVFSVLFFVSIYSYFSIPAQVKINFKEKSDINYTVNLKENDFFSESSLPKNKQYISELIDDINSNLNYYLKLESDIVNYSYSYDITYNASILDKTSKNQLYSVNDSISSNSCFSKSGDFEINEDIKIDYNYYNTLAKDFISTYSLDNAVSTLKVVVDIKLTYDIPDFNSVSPQNIKLSLEIPLNEKTFNISSQSNLISNNLNYITFSKKVNYFPLVLAAFDLIIIIISITKLKSYLNRAILLKTKYEKQLQKLLTTYSDYIQEIKNYPVLIDYTILQVTKFEDLIDLRETLQLPILMVKNVTDDNISFFILSNKICYIYEFKCY